MPYTSRSYAGRTGGQHGSRVRRTRPLHQPRAVDRLVAGGLAPCPLRIASGERERTLDMAHAAREAFRWKSQRAMYRLGLATPRSEPRGVNRVLTTGHAGCTFTAYQMRNGGNAGTPEVRRTPMRLARKRETCRRFAVP